MRKPSKLRVMMIICGKNMVFLYYINLVEHLLYFVEKSQETINAIDRALFYHPNNETFYLYKQNVLMELGRNDEAIEILKKGLEINPNFRYQIILGL